jgi:ubiquinone/menaquinone biosynthesis C-methylase UbiE
MQKSAAMYGRGRIGCLLAAWSATRSATLSALLLALVLPLPGFSLAAQEKLGKNQPPATQKQLDAQKQLKAQNAQLEEKIPPARRTYMGRRIAQTMSFHGASWLIRGEREQEERTSLVLPQLGLKAGMTVCDLGCGNGYYSIAMAKLVAPGKVLAVDIQQEMLHLLKLRAEAAQVDNIQQLLGSAVDPHLPPASVDLVLLVDVYHEFSHPQQMLAAIRKSLKPGGLIALLEYREEDPHVPIKPEHKMSKRQVLKEYNANGLRLAKEYDELPWQHLMFFEADPDWKAPQTADE